MSQRVLIKLGGASLNNPETLSELATLVRGLRARNDEVIIVHGGGPAINAALTAKNISWQFIRGQRQTTPEMMSIISEVLSQQVNGRIVSALREADIPSQALCCARNQILGCVQSDPELMQVGKIRSVQVQPILDALNEEHRPVPVVAPLGFGENGMEFNINADWAASQLAIALKVNRLIFLTDQVGILDQKNELIETTNATHLHSLIAAEIITGGMYTKVLTMVAALDGGVEQVLVTAAATASQLLKSESCGTLLLGESYQNREESSLWNRNQK